MRRIVLTVSSVIALGGCGGGGGGGASPQSSVSGKIIDGYITGAKVFWDCNANSIADADEVSTSSTDGGNYVISPSPKAGCRLTAYIPASAIDSDTNTSVLTPYTMYALDSNSAIITPLTTLVVLNSSGNNQAVVAEEIKQKFGLSLSIDTDYVAGNSDAHTNDRKFAKVTAQLLQGSYSTTTGYDTTAYQTISSNVESLKNTIKTSSLSDSINRIIGIPIGFLKQFTRYFYADPSLGVKVNPQNLSADQISYLNTLIADVRVVPYIGGGVVDWKRMNSSSLQAIHNEINNKGFSSSEYAKLSTEWNDKKMH